MDKVRQLGASRKYGPARLAALPQPETRTTAPVDAPPLAPKSLPEPHGRFADPAKFILRAMPVIPPRVLLIGASTGGPQALNRLISGIGQVVDLAPVLITQHMPPTFTTILAEHLTRSGGHPAHEAVHGEEIRAGQIYIAPGGKHMRVARRDGNAMIALDDGPPVNYCKPAVDPMFASAAEVWRGWVLALILTGMGSDGTRGAAEVVAAGGHVIAQDDTTSVVWGMPGTAAHAGLCSAVLPLDQIGPRLVSLFSGGRA
jgi:two-component system chemotaxis response regulator CheB